MGYRVTGTDRATGERKQILSKAKDEPSARRSAEALGLTVELLEYCGDPLAEEAAQKAAAKSAPTFGNPSRVVDPSAATQSHRRRFGALLICIGAAFTLTGVAVTVFTYLYDIPRIGTPLMFPGGILILLGALRKLVESQDD
jgi:hypothetical protein